MINGSAMALTSLTKKRCARETTLDKLKERDN